MKKDAWMIALTAKKPPPNTRMNLKPKFCGILINKAGRLFDSDNYDSHGGGVSNFNEREFGADSLVNDRNSILPWVIRKKVGYEFIVFNHFTASTKQDTIKFSIL